MATMKVLVVGCGSIGARHLTVLGWRDDLSLAACDPGPGMAEKIAGMNGAIPFYADLTAALAWGPELVIVATPNHLHEQTALAAFEAGSHVLCEKPIAESVAAGQRMVAAAASRGLWLGVGYTERFRPAWQYIKSLVAQEAFGVLVGGRAMVGTYNTILCSRAAATNPMLGSIIVDYTHELDMLHDIFGEADEVFCRANNLGERDGLACQPHLAVTVIGYRSGALVSVHMDYLQHPQRRLLEIVGDRQTIAYDLEANSVRLYTSDPLGCLERTFPTARNETFAAEHADMIDAIRQGRPPAITGADGVAVLDVASRAIAQLA